MPMNNSQIKWRILKALNALYENGKTPSTILSDGFVDYLTHTRRLLRRKLSNANYLEPCNGFAAYYEKNFKTDFQNAEQFLSAAGPPILHAQRHQHPAIHCRKQIRIAAIPHHSPDFLIPGFHLRWFQIPGNSPEPARSRLSTIGNRAISGRGP